MIQYDGAGVPDMKARHIEAIVNGILRQEYGVPSETTNGIVLGDPEREVTHLVVCWSPTAIVLREAVALGAEAVLSHETPFIPVSEKVSELWPIPLEDSLPANVKRRRLWQDHRLVLLKYHYPLDGWPVWGTPRALADALGFDPDQAEWINRFVPAFDCAPQSLVAFAEHVRVCLEMTGLAITGRPDLTVRKVALIIGGFGTRFWISEFARQAGCDAMIVGELLDYTARAALEADVAVIQAGHYATENPAVIKLAKYLQAPLGHGVRVTYLASGHPWVYGGAPGPA